MTTRRLLKVEMAGNDPMTGEAIVEMTYASTELPRGDFAALARAFAEGNLKQVEKTEEIRYPTPAAATADLQRLRNMIR